MDEERKVKEFPLKVLILMALSMPAHAARPAKDEPPPLTYQIVSVYLAGGGTDDKGSVLLEQQTGRSWILIQRGSAPPAWQALAFDSGFTLNQQLVPPDLTSPRPGTAQ
jgi:hypothetical protein